MQRNFVTDSLREVSARAVQSWRPIGAVALAGLNALALLLSFAGSQLSSLAWAGALAVLASTLLFSGVGRRFLARFPRLPGGRPIFGIATSLLVLILLSLMPGSAPAANSEILISFSSQPGTVAPGDLITWKATSISLLEAVLQKIDSYDLTKSHGDIEVQLITTRVGKDDIQVRLIARYDGDTVVDVNVDPLDLDLEFTMDVPDKVVFKQATVGPDDVPCDISALPTIRCAISEPPTGRVDKDIVAVVGQLNPDYHFASPPPFNSVTATGALSLTTTMNFNITGSDVEVCVTIGICPLCIKKCKKVFDISDFIDEIRQALIDAGFTLVGSGGNFKAIMTDVLFQSDAESQVRPRADLAVTKLSVPGTSVGAGETFTYTITVDNNGPSVARNVVLTDTILSDQAFTIDLPPTFIGAAYSCSTTPSPSGGQVLKCTRNDTTMDPGARDQIIITGRANETSTLNDTVEVSSPDDPATGNNTARDSITIKDTADLSVTKVKLSPPGDVTAGQTISYRISVTNTGPSTAEAVVVRDTVPSYVEDNILITPSKGTCTPGLPGPFTCNLDTLNSGETATIDVTFTLNPGYPIDPVIGANIQNQVTVSSRTFDPDNSDNQASVTTPVVASADLALTKTSVPTTVKAGDTFQYDITITNNGPSAAQDVVFEDPLPSADFVPVSVRLGGSPFSQFGCSLGGGDNTVRCHIGRLEPGKIITGTLNVRVAPDALRPFSFLPHTFTNTAHVSTTTPEAGPGPNIASADTTVEAEADLDLIESVIDSPEPVVAGNRLMYRITLSNLGPSVAPTPVITHTFSFTPTASGVVTYAGSTELCRQTGPDEIVCELQDSLEPREQDSFTLFVDVDPSFKGQITDIATTSSRVFDPYLYNNLFVQFTRVNDQADLRVTKVTDQDHDSGVIAGTPFTYTIVVENNGPSDARNVVLTDTLDPQVTFSSASPPQTSGPNPLVWNQTTVPAFAQLPAGARVTFTVVVTANQDIANPFDTLSDRVEVSSDAEDPNTFNNSTTKLTRPRAFSDMQITKTALGEVVNPPTGLISQVPDEVTAGAVLTYSLRITNTGPSDATGVVIRDSLPSMVIVQSVNSPGGGCQVTDSRVTCNQDTLVVGDSISVTIVVTTSNFTADGTLLHNNASVSSSNFDPDNSDNITTNTTTVNTRADLVIAKTDDPDPVIAGEILKYTITVTNTGPSDALNVVVSDTLPVNGAGEPQVVLRRSESDRRCKADVIHPEKVTCELGRLSAGQSETFNIVVDVKPDVVQAGETFHNITNTADVLSDTLDPVTTNNRATQTTRVEAQADLFITKKQQRESLLQAPETATAGKQVAYTISFGNRGPSTARTVTVTDVLPAKFVFNHCESVDPDDAVTCSVVSGTPLTGQTVRVDELKTRGTLQLPGDLDPGEKYSFVLVVDVESAYVLDKGIPDPVNPTGNPANPAHNTAYIASETTSGPFSTHPDVNPNDNQDTALTTVEAEADLQVTKTDTPDPSLPDSYLRYDPVSNKFTYTYTVTIENLGPSDAAKVVMEDTLPDDVTFVPASLPPECLFRDDGTLLCLIGDGPSNSGVVQQGRLNAGGVVTVTFAVEVDPGRASRTLRNRVTVSTIAAGDFPFPNPNPQAPFLPGTTPTDDPNLRNNTFTETTSVVNAEVKVDKKAYINRSPARGVNVPVLLGGLTPAQRCLLLARDDVLALPGDEIVYCYTITNPGNTWFQSVTLQDTPSGIQWLNLSNFGLVSPDQPPLRGTITLSPLTPAITQTITISTSEGTKAVLAPAGVADDYRSIIITRTATVDFLAGNGQLLVLGTNTARVDAVPSTKYSTPLPGVPPVFDTDVFNDNLALPSLEDTTKRWSIFNDHDLDGLPSPGDTIKYSVEIPNTGANSATGIIYKDVLYNYIADDPDDARVPAKLVNGSVKAALHVFGVDPVSGEVFDFDVEPPSLAITETLTLLTQASMTLTVSSQTVLSSEIVNGNQPGDDEILIRTRIDIPPRGSLTRIGSRSLPRPVPVTFSLRISYLVTIKETVPVDAIVLNQGAVAFDEIDLFDQHFPKFDGTVSFVQTLANRIANNHNATAAQLYVNPEQPGRPRIPAGYEPTDDPDTTADDDPTQFTVQREAASLGGDTRIQVPVLAYIGRSGEDSDALIEVQNVGGDVTRVALYLWASYSGFCDTQAPGPFKVECSGRLLPGSTWTWRASELPAGAYSGILVSYDRDQFSCTDMATIHLTDGWLPDQYFGGQPVTAAVVRTGPGSRDPGVNMSGAYEGISRAMEGVRDPVSDAFQYYVPNVYSQSGGFTSWLYVQNSGDECTSVEMWLRERDQCIRPSICRISKLAPGETRAVDVAAECGLGGGFEGSATLRSSQPLGVVVDNVGPDVLLTSRGVPASIDYGQDFNGSEPYFTAGSLINYGPLIYREYQGWDTKLWVQNLSSIFSAKVKVYFLDASGDIITTIVDWVCPRGSQAFYLPVISGLPGNYVGAVRVESQGYWTPGDPSIDSPRILSVAELRKYEGPARTEVLEGIAYNLFGEDDAYDWQVGEVETWGVRRIAIPSLNNKAGGYTTEFAVQNLVANPGFTDFALYFYDQNGLIDYVCQKLNQKQVEYIAINTWGFIAPHFEGSAVISATYWTHAGNNQTGKSVGLAAVAVERVGTVLSQDIPGDESSGVQGIPIHRPFEFQREFEPPICQP